MRRFICGLLCAALMLLPAGCGVRGAGERAAAVQEKYAGAEGVCAVAEVEIVCEEENLCYTLRLDMNKEGAKVTVLAPELLAGVTARLSTDGLKLEYDGLVLDAGGPTGGLGAVNCVPLALRAAAEGYLLECGEERFGEEEHALRAAFENDADGETLRCTIWFDGEDAPLYAEIEKNEKITACMEFTSFAFCDTMPLDGGAAES